ncbi:MAG TPA: hypothetical protein VFO85_22175, partial [Vicinamibacteria bacterium]|nr:hypothetical protein [Vicinamibacteria bacterium]
IALAVGTAAGCATADRSGTFLGRSVTVVPAEGAAQRPVQGELIAVEPERIWVLGREQAVPVPLNAVREVRVQRHRMTRSRGWAWTAIGALVTGGALAVACGSVEGNDGCGAVFAAVAGTWVVLGGLPSLALDQSAMMRLTQPTPEQLRPYARYPQGAPPAVDLQALRPPAPTPPEKK